jgi:hypothetical protein
MTFERCPEKPLSADVGHSCHPQSKLVSGALARAIQSLLKNSNQLMDRFTNLVLSQSNLRYASVGGSGMARSLAWLSAAYLGAEAIGM